MRVNPEKKEEKERAAHALLRVTLRLAAAHGFVSLGLREVSRAADIAPTSFYRHFADMEELGLALIDGLAGRFMKSWVDEADVEHAKGFERVERIARQALVGASEDPELMRFILAERLGAIPSFRAALRRELFTVSAAVEAALGVEFAGGHAESRAGLAEGVVVLILEACGKTLDLDPARSSLLAEQFELQLRKMFDFGATRGRG
ncbi:MAG TPA: TetR family transcriptional regulator [Polyangiaceae bacterium]|nr:TetR family transcriptional regulator [Polyangiaceae bacterium]